MSAGKEIMNGIANAPAGNSMDTLKAISGLVAGSILFSYIVSKVYKNPLQSTYEWIMGKPKTKKVRRSRKARENRRRESDRKRLEESYEDEESINDRDAYYNKNGMTQISEHVSGEQESSLYEDVLVPSPDDCTSITYSDKRNKKMYFNSNDEIVESGYEDESALNFYVQPSKTNIKSKLYKQRETEASKFVDAIDHAINSFKKDRVKNYENINEAFKANKLEAIKSKKKEIERQDSKEPLSLNEKFKAEMQQLSPRSRKEKLKNLNEKSVRLNDSDFGNIDDKDSALASENVFRNKGKDKKFVPNSKELTSKKDYIFFELLSVYTQNFVQNKKQKKSKKKGIVSAK
ncbi:unnamed protein product [Moneuplotes crassus]|uniref:Uncharacterized protein n=1 Tax=Euplotes crassus TaxID=5936 RepID=A0AAD2CY72_EUPCR|nr:unnamed protein product [Moneuplotes crassus]